MRSPVPIAPLLKRPEHGGRRVDSLADILCVWRGGGLAHSLCAVLNFEGRVRLDGLQPGVCRSKVALNGVSQAMQSDFTPRGSSSYSSLLALE
jgi:hypothetical protein